MYTVAEEAIQNIGGIQLIRTHLPYSAFLHLTMEFHMDFCIHGYHIYKEVWTAVFGKELYTERELGNIIDHCTIEGFW